MKRIWAAAFLGALAGVSVAGAVQFADAYLPYLPLTNLRIQGIPPSPIEILMTTTGAAGPGAFVLAFGLSLFLRARVERGASRGRVLALGALGGLPAGMLNLLFLMVILGGAREIPNLLSAPHSRTAVAAALAGGIALGLTCAWVVSRPPKVPA